MSENPIKDHNFYKKNGTKASVRSKQQYLIWCVLSNPEICSWPRETKMASGLLKEFPDLEFWRSAPRFFDFKPDSLAYCLGLMGMTLIKEAYPVFQKLKNVKFKQKKSPILGEHRIGEDIKINKKPKTILDFIRLGHGGK